MLFAIFIAKMIHCVCVCVVECNDFRWQRVSIQPMWRSWMQLLKICSRSCLIVTLSCRHVMTLLNMTLYIPHHTHHTLNRWNSFSLSF